MQRRLCHIHAAVVGAAAAARMMTGASISPVGALTSIAVAAALVTLATRRGVISVGNQRAVSIVITATTTAIASVGALFQRRPHQRRLPCFGCSDDGIAARHAAAYRAVVRRRHKVAICLIRPTAMRGCCCWWWRRDWWRRNYWRWRRYC